MQFGFFFSYYLIILLRSCTCSDLSICIDVCSDVLCLQVIAPLQAVAEKQLSGEMCLMSWLEGVRQCQSSGASPAQCVARMSDQKVCTDVWVWMCA